MVYLGNYNLAFQFLIVFMVIPGALFAYLLPEKSSGSARREVEVVGLAVAVVITVLGILLAPYVIRWLFPHFEGSIKATRVISLTVVPTSIVSIRGSELLSRGRSGILLVAGTAAMVVHVVGIIFFGLWYQTAGFALAFLLS
jgi:O-antigen/teichoic acid export membrane protein